MRSKYDDEWEDSSQGKGVAQPPLGRAHLEKQDAYFALGVGLFVALLTALFHFPGLNPEVWNEVIVASGVRPAETILPGLWRLGMNLLCHINPHMGMFLLQPLGWLFAGINASLAYLLIRSLILLIVRSSLRTAPLRNFVQHFASCVGAILFSCSDPVWRLGQTFCSSSFLVTLTLAGVGLFISFLLNGRIRFATMALFLLGLLASESLLGVFLLLVCIFGTTLAYRYEVLPEDCPLLSDVVGAHVKWRLTFFWFSGFFIGIALNCFSFAMLDGLLANGYSAGDIPLVYLSSWARAVLTWATPFGYLFAFITCVLPFLVNLIKFAPSCNEERLLPYHVGFVSLCCVLLSYMQLSMLGPLWFWNWTSLAQVHDSFFHAILMFTSSTCVASGLVILGTDVLCRNFKRIARMQFADRFETENNTTEIALFGRRAGMYLFFGVLGLFLLGSVCGRPLFAVRRMLALIEDYAQEVITEARGAKWLFTDGSFDARIEIGARAQGSPLVVLSAQDDNSPYHVFLRQRGVTNLEDLASLAQGSQMALRSWMHDRPEMLSHVATQISFGLWKRDGKEIPVCSGVLSRPSGMDPQACQEGIAHAKQIAHDMIDLASHHPRMSKEAGYKINELFRFAQWRISRMARMRSERLDRSGESEASNQELELSKMLDETNDSVKRMMAALERARATALKQISLREGLQMALARADFVQARRYADIIIKSSPEDVDANFALGMSFYNQKQWTRSEEHLRRVLKARPKQPAVWNNLAMIQLNLARLEKDEKKAHEFIAEAREQAQKALQLIPESAEVKDTIRKIEDFKFDSQKKKEESSTK